MSAVLAPAPAAPQVPRWVCFALGHQRYGVELLQVQEVLRVPDITPVPGARPIVVGVMNLRGAIVSVVDLRRHLKLPDPPPTAESRIVVGLHAGHPVGLLVDGISDVLQLTAEEMNAAPNVGAGPRGEAVQGFVRRGEDLVVLLDLQRVLADCTATS